MISNITENKQVKSARERRLATFKKHLANITKKTRQSNSKN